MTSHKAHYSKEYWGNVMSHGILFPSLIGACCNDGIWFDSSLTSSLSLLMARRMLCCRSSSTFYIARYQCYPLLTIQCTFCSRVQSIIGFSTPLDCIRSLFIINGWILTFAESANEVFVQIFDQWIVQPHYIKATDLLLRFWLFRLHIIIINIL